MVKNVEFEGDEDMTAGESTPSKMPIEAAELGQLIAMFKESGVTDFELRGKNLHLKIAFNRPAAPQIMQSMPQQMPVAEMQYAAPQMAPAAAAPEVKEEKPGVVVKSPMVGTFYRSPSPDASPYADVGMHVTEESVLCIVEAMKIMNEIKAETRGVVAEVLVENGHPVEYGQPLFRIVTS